MQLKTNKSAEGYLSGLSWVDAETIKFEYTDNQFRIPHMAWNQVSKLKNHNILVNIDINNSRYYFVHSYYVKYHNKDDVLLKYNYISDFDAAFQKDNIFEFNFIQKRATNMEFRVVKTVNFKKPTYIGDPINAYHGLIFLPTCPNKT
jgi:imidazole glycerol-phosphate synthase subunit HisH